MHGSRGPAGALPLHSIQAKTEKAYMGEPAGWVSHHIINFTGTVRCNTSGACFSYSAPQLFYLRRDLPHCWFRSGQDPATLRLEVTEILRGSRRPERSHFDHKHQQIYYASK